MKLFGILFSAIAVDAKNNGTATTGNRGHSYDYEYYTQGYYSTSRYYTTSEPYTTTTQEDQSCPHYVKNGWIVDGISLNRWFYGDWGGGKDCMNLADDDVFTQVQYGTCSYTGATVISDMTFYSKSGRTFGPYGNCESRNAYHYKGPYYAALDMENIALQFEYEESGDKKFITRIKDASEINENWVCETKEDCYDDCGQGGECDFCKGFCCSNDYGASNGNCPAVALSSLKNAKSKGKYSGFYCITEGKSDDKDDKEEFNWRNKEPIELMDTILSKYQTFMVEYLPKHKNNDKTFMRHVTRTAKKPKKNYQKHNEKCEYYTPEYEKEDNVDRLGAKDPLNAVDRLQRLFLKWTKAYGLSCKQEEKAKKFYKKVERQMNTVSDAMKYAIENY